MPSNDVSGNDNVRGGAVPILDDRIIEARCPRCGYDLRGTVRAWRESSPLTGTCAECGLEFGWDYILRPDRLAPPWCVEFARRRRGIPIAAAKTLLRSFWPWGFWKRINMAFPMRWGRLAIYIALLLVVPLTTIYITTRAGLAVYVRWNLQKQVATLQQSIPAQVATLQAAVIQPSHVGVWAAIPSLRIAAMFDLQRRLAAHIAMMQQSITTPPVIEHSHAAAILEAVFMPLAKQSSGSIVGWQAGTGVRGRIPYPIPPSGLLSAAINYSASNSYRNTSPFLDAMTDGAGPTVMWLGVLGMLPLSLALLPVTRRRAKVRWSHIARVAAYSVFIPITIVCLTIVVWLMNEFTDFSGWSGRNLVMLIPLAGMPLLGACWWAVAIRRYLRMPHAEAVAALLGLLCLLMTGAAMFWIGQALAG